MSMFHNGDGGEQVSSKRKRNCPLATRGQCPPPPQGSRRACGKVIAEAMGFRDATVRAGWRTLTSESRGPHKSGSDEGKAGHWRGSSSGRGRPSEVDVPVQVRAAPLAQAGSTALMTCMAAGVAIIEPVEHSASASVCTEVDNRNGSH